MYVDAKLIGDTVWVNERDKAGNRRIYQARAPYEFYHSDDNGDFRSIRGERIRRVRAATRKAIQTHIDVVRDHGCETFESDVPVVFRYLENEYPTDEMPDLRVSFLDIEVDKDPIRNYSTTKNAFNPINAVTIHHRWLNSSITIAVPPPGMSMATAQKLLDDDAHPDGYGSLTEENGYFLVESEAELLLLFLDIIEESDVLTGWNSRFYDIPYIIARIRIVLGGELIEDLIGDRKFAPTPKSVEFIIRMGLFPCLPKMSWVENYKSLEPVFEIFGRKHLDYMELFKKFYTKKKLHSYSLESVLRNVVNQGKVKYDGDIGTFWRKEFRKFLAYNRQDVEGMVALDIETKMIALANQMAHMAGVTLDKVTGSVAIIEQAILKTLHSVRNVIAFDKAGRPPDKYVPGAFVVVPVAGLYKRGASYDVNSLYPMMVITANISPETMVGQLDLSRTTAALNQFVDDILKIHPEDRMPDMSHRNQFTQERLDEAYTESWHKFTCVLEYHDVIDETNRAVTLDFVNGTSITVSAKEMKALLKEKNWCLTGNGTIFDLNREGIVPYCLRMWYEERAKFRAEGKSYEKKAAEAKKAGNEAEAKKYQDLADYYDMIQQAKKLFLNSTYGAYLNAHFRFYDPRCGRSVTLSGRAVTKHMVRKGSEVLTGNYDFDSRAIIYGDTDSAYISLDWYMRENGIENTHENMAMVADQLGDLINESFPQFLRDNFCVDEPHSKFIKAKRENVFETGLFKNEKKRYALHVVNSEGKITDEVKITGLDIKRTDTPEFIQEFLLECVTDVVRNGKGYAELSPKIDAFRDKFRAMPAWNKGSPVTLSNLVESDELVSQYRTHGGEKPRIYWAVLAAINTNELLRAQNESQRWEPLKDGDKIDVLYLKDNAMGMSAVAIRHGETYAPDWFKNLPFDDDAHEEKLITKKLENIFGGLGWEFFPNNTYADDFF